MQYIVGDIGNTSTRICLLKKNQKLLVLFFFNTKKYFYERLFSKNFKKLLKKEFKKKILFSCVIPLALKEIKKLLKNLIIKF